MSLFCDYFRTSTRLNWSVYEVNMKGWIQKKNKTAGWVLSLASLMVTNVGNISNTKSLAFMVWVFKYLILLQAGLVHFIRFFIFNFFWQWRTFSRFFFAGSLANSRNPTFCFQYSLRKPLGKYWWAILWEKKYVEKATATTTTIRTSH